MPFLIAINEFDDAPRHPPHEVRKALALSDHIPIITVDAQGSALLDGRADRGHGVRVERAPVGARLIAWPRPTPSGRNGNSSGMTFATRT